MPTEEIAQTTEAYPLFDKEKFETEVFYCRSNMHEYCKLFKLQKFILKNNLEGILSEIMILIILMTTSEPEHCFSTLKNKNFSMTKCTCGAFNGEKFP